MILRRILHYICYSFKRRGKSPFISEKYLHDFLSDTNFSYQTQKLIQQSFRTRLKIHNSQYIFQFRIDPISTYSEDVIYDIKNEIAHIAKNYYPDKEISIEINQKECCKKACWHCKKYLSGKI